MVLRFVALAVLAVGAPMQAQEPVRIPAKGPGTVPTRVPGEITGKVPARKTPVGAWVLPAKIGWLGFRTDPTDSQVILEVAPGSPAERAGLQAGDRIISSDPLHDVIRARDTSRAGLTVDYRSAPGPIVGRTYQMILQRGSDTFRVAMVAIAPPDDQLTRLRPTRAPGSGPDTLLAEVDAYRTELARTTLQPTQRSLATPPRRGEAVQTRVDSAAARGREAFAVTRQKALESSYQRAATLLALRKSAVSGAEFEQLNPALGQYFGGVSEGVFVLRVGAESPAAIAGLEPGDIVESVNGERIATIPALRDRVAEATGTITLQVIRKGRPATVTLRKE